MKKLPVFKIVFFSVCFFILTSCGLDTFYYLYAPFTVYDPPTVTSANYDNQTDASLAHFDFRTNDSQGDADEIYEGTGIYYRIYNNYSSMASDVSNLSSLSTSSNAQASATQMLNLKYCELGACYKKDDTTYKEISLSPFFKKNSPYASARFCIRLTNGTGEYIACIKTIGTNNVEKFWMYNESSGAFSEFSTIEDGNNAGYYLVIPMRKGGITNFDFGRKYTYGKYQDNYVVPSENDDDFKMDSSPSKENVYYVSMYAVAVGRDEQFVEQYSGVLHLGCVAIDSSTENN